jgi:formate hydrogenlyase subunit 4
MLSIHWFTSGIPWLLILGQALLYVLLAPLFAGWIGQVRARLQHRRGAPLMQPYRTLRKLGYKEIRLAPSTSPLFRLAPGLVFSILWVAAATIPLLTLATPVTMTTDLIVLIGLLALARAIMTLAAMDTGTAFGGLGASRDLLISALAEPALLLVILTLAITTHHTQAALVMTHHLTDGFALRPSYLFALGALMIVAIAETGRIPVDNPTTHLELTMIHEALMLEYSGRHLALMLWAGTLRLFLYAVLLINLFFPWGLATTVHWLDLLMSMIALIAKSILLGAVLAISETVLAKMRLFRAPAFLHFALLLALLGLLSHILLEH